MMNSTFKPVSQADRQLALRELLQFVREHSPYYQALYQQVPLESHDLNDYPILSLDDFWSANTIDNNRVFTTTPTAGITFKSGGSTGNPKYSVYSNEDWHHFTSAFGQGLRSSGILPDAKIGNLFYAGRLYASFLFISRSIEQSQVGMCYPIAGIESSEIIEIWKQFQLNTLVGVPTTLMNLLTTLNTETAKDLSLDYFLYGGEPMFPDQIELLQKYFPDCQVRSIGIAGVDYGELGWTTTETELGVHHCFDESTILEIIDDHDQVIEETGITGRLVITNLKRKLMPLIRYPVGDQGVWIDPPNTPWRRFKVLGRSDNGARIGPMTLYVEDVSNLVSKVNAQFKDISIVNFQIKVTHFDQKDCCTLRFVNDAQIQAQEIDVQIAQLLYQDRSMFADLIQEKIVHPLQIEWIQPHQLITNPRTGKSIRVIDQRHDA